MPEVSWPTLIALMTAAGTAGGLVLALVRGLINVGRRREKLDKALTDVESHGKQIGEVQRQLSVLLDRATRAPDVAEIVKNPPKEPGG